MTDGIALLCGTAAAVGFLHTLLGPDHYLPFVAMSRAGDWSLTKTISLTVLCGLGHVLSSVVLGMLGIALGIGVLSLETFEQSRGDLAGWLLLAFGLVYFVWGVRRAIRYRPHTHLHGHSDGTVHAHEHVHSAPHVHVHTPAEGRPHGLEARAHGAGAGSMTPWVLFTIFLFGPCEPLIPLLMYPAAKGGTTGVVLVTVTFGITTIATMTTIVVLAHTAFARIQARCWRRFSGLERYAHALAGLVVLLCGAGIKAGL